MLVKSLTKPVRISQRIVTSGLLLPSWRKPMETPRWWRKSLTEPSRLLGPTVWKSTESNGYRYFLGVRWTPRCSVLKAPDPSYCRVEEFCSRPISGDSCEDTRGETKKPRGVKATVQGDLEWCCVWGILNQFTTRIAYSGSRQQNVLSTLLKRVLIVFNIKQISLLTSESVITL